MALNGISTATSTDAVSTKLLRRDLKLNLAAAKRQQLSTIGYRPLNVITGTHIAYVGTSTVAESGTTSPVIGRPWSYTPPAGIIHTLFANGEQGAFYDPYESNSIFQNSAGTTATVLATQPIGLAIDVKNGVFTSSELIGDTSFDDPSYWLPSATVSVTGGNLVFNNSPLGQSVRKSGIINYGSWYSIQVNVTSVTSGAIRASVTGGTGSTMLPYMTTAGIYNFIVYATGTTNNFQIISTDINVNATAVVSDVSVKELYGNHAFQPTVTYQPLLQSNPTQIAYDGINDNLITYFPTAMNGCTVVRAIPNVGTQVLTNQSIPSTYVDSTSHSGLLIINRDLTPYELSQVTQMFNTAAGV